MGASRWLTLVLLGLSSAWCAADADWNGPLRLRNEHPFVTLFAATPPLDARVPTRPRLEFDGAFANTYTYNNTAANSPPGQLYVKAPKPIRFDLAALAAQAPGHPSKTYYVADTETTRLLVRYTRPTTRRSAFEVEVPLFMDSGGWLDDLIGGFHRMFGMNPVGRQHAVSGQSQLLYAHGRNVLLVNGQRGPQLGDVTLRELVNLVPGNRRRPWVSVSAAVKVPTGAPSQLGGSGCWDATLGLHLTGEVGRLTTYGTLGWDWHGGWRGMSDVGLRNPLDLHLGADYRLTRDWSLVTAFSFTGAALKVNESGSLGRPASTTALAARRRFGANSLEFGYLENIVNNENAHDFGLYSKWRMGL